MRERVAAWVRGTRRLRRPPAAAWSLRRRLLLTTLGSSVACWLVSLAVIVGVAWHETSDVFDDALEEGARLAAQLGVALQREGRLEDEDIAVDRSRHRVRLAYQLLDERGRVLRRAELAPARAFVADAEDDDDSFHTVWVDGRLWRVYVRPADARGVTVQIGQHWDDRSELLWEMAENLVWPALGLLALLTLLNALAIRRLLRPLERIAEHIAARSPDDLAPAPSAGQARELQPIIAALNAVFGRLTDAMLAERRFTADAAHELRTPLSALRMRIQLLQRQHGSDGALQAELQRVRDDVDRCTALVENLLALARLDPQRADTLAREPAPLVALVNEAIRACAPAAQARGITLETACAEVAPMLHRALFLSAICNLVDNAVRYGRDGGRVRIEAAALPDGGLRLAVRDDGPGVPADARARLGQRFFRVLGSGAAGSGLGLSIVARIAALHGGTLRFADGLDGRGLSAIVDLPAMPRLRSSSSSAV